MDDMEKKPWLMMLANLPLISVAETAAITRMTTDAVRRRFRDLESQGFLISTKMGMIRSQQERFWVTSTGVKFAYENGHHHLLEKDIDRIDRSVLRLNDYPISYWTPDTSDDWHGHDPFGNDEPVGHVHPPASAKEDMVRNLIRRLPRLELIYRVAPGLLTTGIICPDTPDPRPQRIARMTDFLVVPQSTSLRCGSAVRG